MVFMELRNDQSNHMTGRAYFIHFAAEHVIISNCLIAQVYIFSFQAKEKMVKISFSSNVLETLERNTHTNMNPWE